MRTVVTIGDVVVRRPEVRDPTRDPEGVFTYVDISSVDTLTKTIVAPRRLLGADAPSRARRVIRAGDVVVSTTRPNLNAVALVPPEFDNQICSTGFTVLRSNGRVAPWYLFQFVRSPAFVAALSELVQGALYPAVTDSQVLAQPIPLPRLDAQQRIAAQLTEQLAAVDRARGAAEHQLRSIVAMEQQVRDGLIPQDGQRVRLGELCEFVRGVTFTKADERATAVSGYVPVLRANNIESKLVVDRDLIWVPEHVVAPEQRLREGDIVIAMSSGSPAVVGKTAPLRDRFEGTVGAFCGIVRATDQPMAAFLAHWFRTSEFRDWRDAQARGASIQNLRFSTLAEARVTMPRHGDIAGPVALLDQRLEPLHRARSAAVAQLGAAGKLPAALLREAFDGLEAA